MEKEIQQRVQQQERLAAVGQLAAGIAHDFNNILAVVTLYTDLSLLDHSLPATILQRFETIKRQAERATELTRQILDFGRRSVMERAPLDLVPLLKEMVRLFERTLPENITLQLRYPHSPQALTVNGDVTRLQQVLMNLVVNARDALPDGGNVWIDLQRLDGADLGDALPTHLARRLVNGETSPAWARLSFRDSGPGIAPDVLPHIFEPFYTTKEQSKGTGLGLAQVFGIIKQHDGEIDVVSDAGEGSTFFIYLPLLETNTGPPSQRQPSELPLGRGETILIVEDNASMRQVLESSLQELNYSTRVAANGEDALRFLQDQGDDVALVLTDLVMPAMGGKSLLAALQAAGLRHKVIAMTGHAMFAEKASILALGAVDWLNKPISLERLARVIDRALGDH
jgi:nitrogen-specific signal transduction histidine kinase/CheY-like chemotaxis protein